MKYKILLVDDEPNNLRLLRQMLHISYDLIFAKNGVEALKRIAQKPDLILLDIMMPEMDGYEFCEHLNRQHENIRVPIIFLTSNIAPKDEIKGFDLGAVDYITKPFNPPILKKRIEHHLELFEQRRKVKQQNIELKESYDKINLIATKLSKYLSPQIYNSIFVGDRDVKISTERKYLTIFFSDIVGFTSTSSSLETEELAKWLNSYLNEMAIIALKHKGTLDKFIGDAVMVFFGDPESSGQVADAINSINMANDMLQKANQMGVKIRLGINSGECIVGNFGSENRMDYTVVESVPFCKDQF